MRIKQQPQTIMPAPAGVAVGKSSSTTTTTSRAMPLLLHNHRDKASRFPFNPLICFLGVIIVLALCMIVGMLVIFHQTSHVYDTNHHLQQQQQKQMKQQQQSSSQLQQDLPRRTTKQESSSSSSSSPIVIAYAISLIKCGDKQSNAAGLTDAALVLRHSVHQTSVRNPESGSVYDYKMYAIVHRNAIQCSQSLVDAGFTVLVKDPPIRPKDIEGEFLKKKIHREWCCGADEFVKLYAYLMEEPIVVHVDIDYLFVKPMDDLFHVMLLDHNDEKYRAARQRIPREFPANVSSSWPKDDRVDVFMTRDWPQVMPGRKPGYQAGFLVVRPDQTTFDTIVNVIRKGDYVEGFARDNGWGGKGYGGFVGAMAMQGLLAYVYDEILPGHWVELNQCRFNHMGMDVLYRSQPSFRKNHPKAGQCRNDLDYCEDCMHTNLTDIYNIHYTQCRKPWNCIGEGDATEGNGEKYGKETIPEDSVHLDHCMELLKVWHNARTDLETKLFNLTQDKQISNGQKGGYKREVFQGHCKGNGGKHYLNIALQPKTLKRLPELYK